MQKLLSLSKYSILIVSITLLALVFTGCGKKSEEEQKPAQQAEKQQVTEKAEQPPETADESASKEAERPEEAKTPVTPDLVGKWTGTLDGRSTTLTITEQNGLNFKGKITINYRNPVNQQVEGSFKVETGDLTMKDIIHTRYQGTYRASLVDDFNKMSGTFTQIVDKKSAVFTVIKNK